MQTEHRRLVVKHTERKAKMMMLHEIEMKKLEQKLYSGKVQDKKNELAERTRKESIGFIRGRGHPSLSGTRRR